MKAQLDLEKELRRWREERARKQNQSPKDRRTLRVNGQEVVVISKPKRPAMG